MIQETPCDLSCSPPLASAAQDMATNSSQILQIPSPKIRNPSEDSDRTDSNVAKECNETKEYSFTGANENLVENGFHSEGEHEQRDNSSGEPTGCKEDVKYTCPVCETVMFSSYDFTVHIRAHKDDFTMELDMFSPTGNGFVCILCGKAISSTIAMRRHVLTHSADNRYKCRVCGVSFSTDGNLTRHLRSHSPENGDSLGCDSDGSSKSYRSVITKSPSPILKNLKKKRVTRTRSELNNNVIEVSPPATDSFKRKFTTGETFSTRKKRCDNKLSEILDCKLCDKNCFSTLNLLEIHIEECHPNYKFRCEPCNIQFKSYRALNLHRFMVHSTNEDSLNANQDLTLVDFSSEKFPHIARAVCEQSLQRSNSLYHKFQCLICNRAFPCVSSLNIHRESCGQENYPSSGESHQENEHSSSDNEAPAYLSDRSKRSKWSESSEEIEDHHKREHFFAGLNLQNKSVIDVLSGKESIQSEVVTKSNSGENRDLADIQSIISVASAGGLLHDLSKSPQPTILDVTPPDSGSRVGVYGTSAAVIGEEDYYAAEFKKMKLRGEFPCRLCIAVFPNLRALKGHNRVHLANSRALNGAPYPCNMCPHSFADKSALTRHVRMHNGERPYQCKICLYAFTTKANCERHLKNTHGIRTREEIKKCIIYHPSEDDNTETNSKPNRDDIKRSLFCEKDCTKPLEINGAVKDEGITNVKSLEKITTVSGGIPVQTELSSTLQKSITYFQDRVCNEGVERTNLDVATMTYAKSEFFVPVDTDMKNSAVGDVPLDLSMDVLDLSKKKCKVDNNKDHYNNSHDETEPQDLSKKSVITNEKDSFPAEKTKLFQHHIPKLSQDVTETSSPHHSYDAERHTPINLVSVPVPQMDISKLYSTHPFYFGNGAFPPFPAPTPLQPGPYVPYFIPPPPQVIFQPNATQDFVEMKERLQKELIRGLQLTSGGPLMLDQTAIANAADRLKKIQQQSTDYNWKMESSTNARQIYSPSVSTEVRPTPSVVDDSEMECTKQNQVKVSNKLGLAKHRQDTNTSVKMVIKNGILIPKQKQRRYRTERPFSCEHCPARFTLRSNMERHIKQQHPQFWSQRQRNAATLPIRKTNSLPSKTPQGQHKAQTGSLNLKSEGELSRASGVNDYTNTDSKVIEGRTLISEEVKSAIAHQLKKEIKISPEEISQMRGSDEVIEDEDLVIDEEVKDKENIQAKKYDKAETAIINNKIRHSEENQDLASVPSLIDNLDNASVQTFRQYFHSDEDHPGEGSEEDEEGLVAAGSTSESCNSGSDENRTESENNNGAKSTIVKKKSAYSLAPNRVSCPYCSRKFPWSSSLRRHILTHTGQKPYKCPFCSLLFTTKSNCDRHLLRKHGGRAAAPSSVTQGMNSNPQASTSASNNTPSYTMRNVPERPYKCKNCPSSTFSTLSNLKKHLSTKHRRRYPSKGTQSGYESQGSLSEEIDVGENEPCKTESRINVDPREIHPSQGPSTSRTLPAEQNVVVHPSSDLPFKCHLCEGSFAERSEALDHIRDVHAAEFQMLVSKGVVDAGLTADDGAEEEEIPENNKGRYADYANRKVVCAFCIRRFWSAEDLRRHMRTHTGERPFACDLCFRRFTLKHSMLRHRKKHPPEDQVKRKPRLATNHDSPTIVDNITVSDIASSSKINNNTLSNPALRGQVEDDTDLISNLLGIEDKSMVDQMLTKSAEDAAKLLGVKKC